MCFDVVCKSKVNISVKNFFEKWGTFPEKVYSRLIEERVAFESGDELRQESGDEK